MWAFLLVSRTFPSVSSFFLCTVPGSKQKAFLLCSPVQVVYGEPGSRLVDQAVTPKALIESGGRLRLHADYYIKKQVSFVSGTSI